MILNEDTIPLKSGTHQGYSLSPLPSNKVLKQEKKMKGKQIGKSQARPICTLNDTFEIPQIPPGKSRNNDFRKVVGYENQLTKPYFKKKSSKVDKSEQSLYTPPTKC